MKRNRVYSLDVLRIVATTFILLHHFQQLTGAFYEGMVNFYAGRFVFARMNEFFFILSGYLAQAPEWGKEGEQQSFRRYITPKLIRLLPLLAISALVYEVLYYLYICFGRDTWMMEGWIDIPGMIITSLGLAVGGPFVNPGINNPTWYISVLLLCHGMFYFISWLAYRFRVDRNYLYVAVILFAIGARNYEISLPFLTDETELGYYCFLWGNLLSRYHEDGKHRWDAKKCLIGSGIAGVLIWLYIVHPDWMVNYSGYLLAFVLYPIILSVFRSEYLERLFDHSWLGGLGKITYDVYIWHCPLLLALHVFAPGVLRRVGDSYWYMLLFIPVAYITGTISWLLIDRPVTMVIRTRRGEPV